MEQAKVEEATCGTCVSSRGEQNRAINLLDLPSEILENILKYTSFCNMCQLRRVCRYLNQIAASLLNSEFVKLRMAMQQRFQHIKAQMPRRESARRKHPLARECDIVETLHMRLTLLQMTFGKHIERKHCCFFPGEILDEVYRILRYVEVTPTLSRAYKVTDELFDLTTMAMEYFKEHIEPTLPEITYFATDFLDYTPSFPSSLKSQLSLMDASPSTSVQGSSPSGPLSPQPPQVNPTVKKRLRKLRESMKKNSGQVLALRRELKLTRKRVTTQQRHLLELKARYDDYDQRLQTTSRKLNAVLQELSRCKTELQYWRSKSPAAVPCSCGKTTPTPVMPPLEFMGNDDFMPIEIQEGSSAENELKLVPACYGLPPDDTSDDGHPATSQEVLRGFKRKLDLDSPQTGHLILKMPKAQRLSLPDTE
ncbi:F-box only protein 28-like [Ornithodoros turicata]|uniref:F-box only protein 28-like n=1 Tax=Ornithodoros turicata TaxID=34597 RepID=UPI003139CB69